MLLFVLVLNSLLLLCSIPLYKYPPIYLSFHLLMDIWVPVWSDYECNYYEHYRACLSVDVCNHFP